MRDVNGIVRMNAPPKIGFGSDGGSATTREPLTGARNDSGFINFYLYAIVGTAAVLVSGYVASLLTAASSKDLQGLTFRTLVKPLAKR